MAPPQGALTDRHSTGRPRRPPTPTPLAALGPSRARPDQSANAVGRHARAHYDEPEPGPISSVRPWGAMPMGAGGHSPFVSGPPPLSPLLSPPLPPPLPPSRDRPRRRRRCRPPPSPSDFSLLAAAGRPPPSPPRSRSPRLPPRLPLRLRPPPDPPWSSPRSRLLARFGWGASGVRSASINSAKTTSSLMLLSRPRCHRPVGSAAPPASAGRWRCARRCRSRPR